ncbi:putative pre-mRNA-splicing factor ATP-dependent RNA helicase [Nymphaea thermarum]|nr:putative pre-mRNA-splicing factor ATP-dependent RNA helicase [Nymphaea thermarum]
MATERKRKVSLFDVVDDSVSGKIPKVNGSARYYEILEKRKTLPVWQQKLEFLDALEKSQSLVLVGKTGCSSGSRLDGEGSEQNPRADGEGSLGQCSGRSSDGYIGRSSGIEQNARAVQSRALERAELERAELELEQAVAGAGARTCDGGAGARAALQERAELTQSHIAREGERRDEEERREEEEGKEGGGKEAEAKEGKKGGRRKKGRRWRGKKRRREEEERKEGGGKEKEAEEGKGRVWSTVFLFTRLPLEPA